MEDFNQTPSLSEAWETLARQMEAFQIAYHEYKNDNQRLTQENEALRQENERLRVRFDRMLLVQSVHALLQAGHSEGDLAELCRRLHIDGESRRLLLMAVFNDRHLDRSDRVPLTPFADQELEETIAAIREQIPAELRPLVFPDGDRILVILQLGEPWEPNLLRSRVTAFAESLQRLLPFPPYLAVAEEPVAPGALPGAYAAMQQMIGYKAIMGELASDILFSGGSQAAVRQTGPEALVTEEQHGFVYYVRIGRFDLAKEPARVLCRKRLVADSDIHTLAITMASLKDFFIHAIQSACIDHEMLDGFTALDGQRRIACAESVQAMMEELERLLDALNDAFAHLDPRSSLPRRMMAYVDENYANSNLNVNSVADFFGVSASYATRIFQREYDQTLLQYIHRRRISTAKELLSSGKSIAEIAEVTGYGTSVNMIRSFKKYEGLTPGQVAHTRKGK